MDDLTPEQRSKNMRHIRSKNTSIEIMLRKELWHRGYRYRTNVSTLPGKPDIVLSKYKIAIFCDGEFFHGKDWDELEAKLVHSNNGQYWITKIQKNIERDDKNNKALRFEGWTVLRFWGKDIKRDVAACADVVEEVIFDKKLEDSNSLFSSDL